MKVVILAGGMGTRLAEETETRPKPMVTVGGQPILWHIMRHYDHYGFAQFVIALGYRGEYVKKYVMDYCALQGNLSVNTRTGRVQRHGAQAPDWDIELVDTGVRTNTGGRLKRLAPYVGSETFMATWGDGVSDVDLNALLAFHRGHGRLATLTAVRPPARFGHIELDGDQIVEFSEKPQTREGRINGAYFVLEAGALDYVDGDDTQWEREPLERLAADGQLMAYQHDGFWQCMDTQRDKRRLESLWASGDAPWRVWST